MQSHLRVTEFQKRGLPHVHILLTFEDEDSPATPEQVDAIICAQLPDENNPEEKALYDTVAKCMMHGPCGQQNPNVRRRAAKVCTAIWQRGVCTL